MNGWGAVSGSARLSTACSSRKASTLEEKRSAAVRRIGSRELDVDMSQNPGGRCQSANLESVKFVSVRRRARHSCRKRSYCHCRALPWTVQAAMVSGAAQARPGLRVPLSAALRESKLRAID